MTRLRYDIIPQGGGWSIAMGGAVGPPYPDIADALNDTEMVARFLVHGGDSVEIVVWRNNLPTSIEMLEPNPVLPELTQRHVRSRPEG